MNHSAHRQYQYLFSVALVVGLAFAQNAGAAITVCKSGCSYTSIQAAVNAAPNGATIQVMEGVYIGSVVITNKNLTLKGVEANFTVIDRGPVSVSPAPPAIQLNCTSSHQITITDVTITGGVPSEGFGGSGLENNGCTVILSNAVVTNNGSRMGGGISNDGNMTVKSSTIINNGAELGGGGIDNEGTLTLVSSFVSDNTTTSPGYGGGIQNGGTLVVRYSTISNNYGPYAGGIVNVVGGTAQVIESVVANNNAYFDGGGLLNIGTLNLKGTLVIANQSGGQGGGVFNKIGGNVVLSGSTIINNTAVTSGGGLFADGTTSVTKTIINNNTPNNCGGSGYTCP